jgi:hypothetical protein
MAFTQEIAGSNPAGGIRFSASRLPLGATRGYQTAQASAPPCGRRWSCRPRRTIVIPTMTRLRKDDSGRVRVVGKQASRNGFGQSADVTSVDRPLVLAIVFGRRAIERRPG